jgi:hypothetical protein
MVIERFILGYSWSKRMSMRESRTNVCLPCSIDSINLPDRCDSIDATIDSACGNSLALPA